MTTFPGPAPDRLLASNATLTLLRHVAARVPLLLIVEDLPWIDRASAGVLGFVARRLAGSRAAFLAARRIVPVSRRRKRWIRVRRAQPARRIGGIAAPGRR